MRRQWTLGCWEKPRTVQDVLELVLRSRGLEANTFLRSDLSLLQAYLSFRGMDQAAELMARHIVGGSGILVVGDYDCDGITSAAQLDLFLRDIGHANRRVILPTRAEGYGVPDRAIQEASDCGLLVAVDCGTLDRDAVAAARQKGMDVLIIDHHEVVPDHLAPATVLVNPKHPDCPSSFKEFCSAGLTLLFLTRLRHALNGSHGHVPLDGRYLSLAALGTIADMVPLTEGNRILVAAGLKALNAEAHMPLTHLQRVAGLQGRVVKAGDVAYSMAPRINAAGRMGDPVQAFQLLTAQEPTTAQLLAEQLDRINSERQKGVARILQDVRTRIQTADRRTLVLADPSWNPGLVGIVATKVQQEMLYGPVALLGADTPEARVYKGSVRSVPGYDVHRALSRCRDFLVQWGGHKMAAGVTVEAHQVERFAQRFEEVAREAAADLFVPKGRIDLELDLDLVGEELYAQLSALEPHGMDNPAPVFWARDVVLEGVRTFGRNRAHLSFQIAGHGVPAVFWNGADSWARHLKGHSGPMDAVFRIDWDDYRNRPRLTLIDLFPEGLSVVPSQ
ncbi:exonuclease RecJ [Desulfacinum hydrothermale DSM 13146]|uniref:Single-stranded-DNA-specific exonuclease RecJ n=1 Tax=Desulfacinum hydrothermale DSM 13146 TaxID=1121390 RepID=A0A1W1XEC2_9BACT|nr:single-stranded-DNA-specific exonuclease RecJ [Desulfacinum hydrothermale]SMC21851.1 exonuclease RecJ [Desulfacinum hydrothermale DSM 13146]